MFCSVKRTPSSLTWPKAQSTRIHLKLKTFLFQFLFFNMYRFRPSTNFAGLLNRYLFMWIGLESF